MNREAEGADRISFHDEWAQLKQEAVHKGSTGMQLDGAPGPDGTGSDPNTPGDLEADQKDLASVGDAAYKLWDKLSKHGTDAQFATYQAALELEDDFSIGGAIRDVGDYCRQPGTSGT
ncbi:hypothetical protein [Streptomyces sp. NPDC007083]|uniref:hypothetical protein n=1 Tax=unclassified Streptomyces TaxID=2593676 RepID=UPI0033C2E52B